MAKIPNTLDELKLQKLVVEVVTQRGGFAVKLAHRHLVGVPDLFIKMPLRPSAFLEAKQISVRQIREFPLAVTGPQFSFLQRAAAAGQPSGVIWFMQTPDAFGAAVEDVRDHSHYGDFFAQPGNARWGTPKDRKTIVYDALLGFYNRARQGDLTNGSP